MVGVSWCIALRVQCLRQAFGVLVGQSAFFVGTRECLMPNSSDPLAATNLWEASSPNSSEAASDLSVDASLAVKSVPEASTGSTVPLPGRIGRYRVEALLGAGGFGRVYRAQDEQLGRSVAIKVPDERLLSRLPENEEYLKEARLVAQLSHPHIVPVYDVGSEPGFPCSIVSRLITGGDLALRMRQSRMSYRESAELIESLASALHSAHKQGVIHRDVKPGNILI